MIGLSRITLIAAFLSIACLGTWGGFQYIKLQKSKVQVVQFEQQRDQARQERDALVEINRQNSVAIELLKSEKIQNESAILALEAQRRKDGLKIASLNKIIENQRANPLNHQPLSPVLQAVMEQINIDQKAKSWGFE